MKNPLNLSGKCIIAYVRKGDDSSYNIWFSKPECNWMEINTSYCKQFHYIRKLIFPRFLLRPNKSYSINLGTYIVDVFDISSKRYYRITAPAYIYKNKSKVVPNYIKALIFNNNPNIQKKKNMKKDNIKHQEEYHYFRKICLENWAMGDYNTSELREWLEKNK